jgi:hypothetical protein
MTVMEEVIPEAAPPPGSDREWRLVLSEGEGGSLGAVRSGFSPLTSLDLEVAFFLCRDLPSVLRLRVLAELLFPSGAGAP